MPIYGDLRTVSLVDLLQWASQNKKTGVLEVERNAITKRIEFRKGWVGSCSSNEPSSLLGQFLLSRGRLDETQLQHLLALHGISHKSMGTLLVEMRVLTKNELTREVGIKAEETIKSLFDCDDAFFRFDDGATLDPNQIEVNLPVDELVEAGRTRVRELQRIRSAFESSGVVLRRTDQPIPDGISESAPTQRILDAVDGQRSIAEILLFTRSSEFLVLQFLHRLYDRNVLEIASIRAASPESTSSLDRHMQQGNPEPPSAHMTRQAPPPSLHVDAPEPNAPASVLHENEDVEIAAAGRLMERREYEAAVQVLRATCRFAAGDYARRLLVKAEESFVEQLKQEMPLSAQVPVLVTERILVEHELQPEESFLLSMVDGTIDVQSILWLAPLREVDALLALRRLSQKGVIELAQPSAVGVHASVC